MQRRHQKLIEEGPSPVLSPDVRAAICGAAEVLAKGVSYVGAGTVEFIYEPRTERFYFIEMNTRIQVEHPVTEMLIGHDLVAEQFRVAQGNPLAAALPNRDHMGHALEFRINAEDWRAGFRPSPGRLERWRPPARAGVRVDTFVHPGAQIQPFYDSMIGKMIVHGPSRSAALETAREALRDFDVEGIATTLDFCSAVVADRDFITSDIHTRWVENTFLPRMRS
jgi:acetyl-CoA carboxylase biotin carboxylase subunit